MGDDIAIGPGVPASTISSLPLVNPAAPFSGNPSVLGTAPTAAGFLSQSLCVGSLCVPTWGALAAAGVLLLFLAKGRR